MVQEITVAIPSRSIVQGNLHRITYCTGLGKSIEDGSRFPFSISEYNR